MTAIGGAALLATGCTIDIDSGETVTETYEVEDFERISIDTAWDADIEVGPETSVEVRVDERVLDKVDIEVDGDTLVVDLSDGLFSISGDLDIAITTPKLIGVEVDGASRIDIDDLDGDRFEVDINGASRVTGDGTIGQLTVAADGAAQLDFDRVAVERADVDGDGASRISLADADVVHGSLDGASHLTVGADATVDVDTKGTSSVEQS
jgi:hypothetical protein